MQSIFAKIIHDLTKAPSWGFWRLAQPRIVYLVSKLYYFIIYILFRTAGDLFCLGVRNAVNYLWNFTLLAISRNIEEWVNCIHSSNIANLHYFLEVIFQFLMAITFGFIVKSFLREQDSFVGNLSIIHPPLKFLNRELTLRYAIIRTD